VASGKLLDRRVFYDGDAIFTEGSHGDTAFLIEEGEVRLSQDSGKGHEIEVATIGRNAMFGEMALFDDRPRMATARAKGTATVIAIERKAFEKKLALLAEADRRLLDELIGYCRRTQVYTARQEAPELARETPQDKAIRALLNSDHIGKASRQSDPLLSALFGILISYAQRRLPQA